MTLVSDALAIARAGVRAVDPAAAVRRSFRRRRGGFRVGNRNVSPGPGGRVALVAIGKAAARMAEAALAIAGESTRAIVAVPRGYPRARAALRTVVGEHPIPGAGSFRAGAALLAFVRGVERDDLLIYLLSGGGSATAEVPAVPLTPADLVRTTQTLLASGAPIGTLNTLRRHLSAIKGGQLACAASAHRFATLALSDVVGDPPAGIASGPTVGDPTTFRDAVAVARKFDVLDRLPPRARRRLELGARGLLTDTPGPDHPRLRRAPFVVVGSNRIALRAAARAASARGYVTRVLPTPVVGETQPAARSFAHQLLRAGVGAHRRRALLGGGETTVTLGPHPRPGGRNLEFALASARALRATDAVVLSIGTDGVDGTTTAAGGWVDGRSFSRAENAALDVVEGLEHHDSFRLLERIGGLVRTGPTGTNVMDLHVGLVEPSASRASGPRVARAQRARGYGRK